MKSGNSLFLCILFVFVREDPAVSAECLRLQRPPYIICRLAHYGRPGRSEVDSSNIAVIVDKVGESSDATAGQTPPPADVETRERTSDTVSVTPAGDRGSDSDVEYSSESTAGVLENPETTTVSTPFRTLTLPSTPPPTSPSTQSPEDEIRKELAEPPPNHDKSGPTLMEQIFIDELTAPTRSSAFRQRYFPRSLTAKSTRQLIHLCRKYFSFARRHCRREMTEQPYVNVCLAYFQDCKYLLPTYNHLQDVSQAHQLSIQNGYSGFQYPRLQ